LIDIKLIEFNRATGQVLAQVQDFPAFVVDVPIQNGKFISGEALQRYVSGFVPVWHLERIALLAQSPDGACDVEAMCVQTATPIAEPSFIELRIAAYPDVYEYLDAVVKQDFTAIEAYRNKCLVIKTRYPKPVPELVSDEVLKTRREL